MSISLINKIDSQAGSLATELRNYLINSYEWDVTQLRCPETGARLERISDCDLVALYHLNGDDLVALGEAIEYRVAYCPVSTPVFKKDLQSFTKLKTYSPWRFFCYAIGSLLGYNSDNLILTSTDKLNKPSLETRFAIRSRFFWLIDRLESSDENLLDQLDLAELNNKLILLLAMGGVAKLEASSETQLDEAKLLNLVTTNQLDNYLTSLVTKLANSYKIKHKLPLDYNLTLSDIQKIASSELLVQQAASLKRHNEIVATTSRLNAYTASLASHWQSIKKASQKVKTKKQWLDEAADIELDQMMSELNFMATNSNRQQAVADYQSKAQAKAASLLIKTKNFNVNVVKIGRLVMQAQQPATASDSGNQPNGQPLNPNQPNGLRLVSLSDLFNKEKTND